ncbi:MAG: hypothetical protein ACXAE3_12690 [Candidatus Kariarchaeaceae archaeon]
MGKRDNRSPTTFWFLDSLKGQAKEQSRLLGLTLTDLINAAVAHYLENIEDINPEAAMKQIGREIKDAPRLNQMEKEIDDMRDRMVKISQLESQMSALVSDLETLKENIEGEYLQSIVRTHIDSKVGGTLTELQRILQKLG